MRLSGQRHFDLLSGPVLQKLKPDEETKQEWLAEHFAGLLPVKLQRQSAQLIDDWDDVDTPRRFERIEVKKQSRASSLKT